MYKNICEQVNFGHTKCAEAASADNNDLPSLYTSLSIVIHVSTQVSSTSGYFSPFVISQTKSQLTNQKCVCFLYHFKALICTFKKVLAMK